MTEPLRDKLIRCGWVTDFNADTLVQLIERHYAERMAMLDQAMQAADTLRDCWLEQTGMKIEDDPFVEDACSTIQSIRSELLRSEPSMTSLPR
jgi:hypothetical protein